MWNTTHVRYFQKEIKLLYISLMKSDFCCTQFHYNSDSAEYTKEIWLFLFDKLIILAHKFTYKLIQQMQSFP